MYQQRRGFLDSIPPVTLNLIIINLLVWGASLVLQRFDIDLLELLGLHFWKASTFNPIQLVTYMFLHDTSSLAHVFFNMFSVYMFGRMLEQVWGSKRYLFFYMLTGVGAALAQEAVWTLTWADSFSLANSTGTSIISGQQAISYALEHQPELLDQFYNMLLTVGASGAVFGLLLAFAMVFPNIPMYIMFIPIPIKAKYLVILYGLVELFFGVFGFQGSVAHFAHLGGMIFGFIILWYWRKKGIIGGRIF